MQISKNNQQGFALITVLLIVALITIIATQLIYQQSLTIQRSANMLHQAQANAVSFGLETWIKKGLRLDAESSDIDHLEEEWARPMIAIPFEEGDISGQLFDLQAKINLNNLAEPTKEERELWQAIVKRFFINQELEESLEAVVSDWVDEDNNALLGGAESDTYLLRSPAYRAANQKLVLVQELGLLEGFSPAVIAKITPNVATLPAITKININTANETVLIALADWMSAEIANSWVTERKLSPAKETADFRRFMVEATAFEDDEVNQDLPDTIISVTSQFFYLEGRVNYGKAKQAVSAIFMRENKKQVRLVQRWVGIASD